MDTVPQNMLNYNYKCCEIHLAPVLRFQINVLLIKWKATKIMRAFNASHFSYGKIAWDLCRVCVLMYYYINAVFICTFNFSASDESVS